MRSSWRTSGAYGMLFGCLGLWTACEGRDPTTLFVSAETTATPTALSAELPRTYVKPEGVLFHIRAILGKSWSSFQGSEVESYLGARTGEEKLPGVRGRLYRYGQGEIYVARDEIYAVAYEFSQPVSRLEAIHLLGLPESLLGDLKATSTELVVERSPYGPMRRFSLFRTEPEKEEFLRVMAWKFIPAERF